MSPSVSPSFEEGRFALNLAPAPLLPVLMADRADGLPRCDGDQQPPEILAVGYLGELATADALAEAVEGAQRHVLFIKPAAGVTGQLLARQPDQLLEVAVPEPLDIGLIASPECIQPS